MRLRALLLPTLAAVVVAVAGLALKPSSPSMSSRMNTSVVVGGKTASLKISNYAYAPMKLTVRVGTKVTVTNRDSTAHTLTSGSGAFDTGTINPGQSRSFTVTKPGVYPFYCQFHAFMTGSITVIQ